MMTTMAPPNKRNDALSGTGIVLLLKKPVRSGTETDEKSTTLTLLERVLLLEAEHELSERRRTGRDNRRGARDAIRLSVAALP